MGRYATVFLLGCFPLVFAAPGFCQVEASPVRTAVQSLRDQHAKLQNVRVHYCFLYWTQNLDRLNLSLLSNVKYEDILAQMANDRLNDIPLQPETIAYCVYRQKGQKEFMEIESVFTSMELKNKLILSFDGDSGFRLEREKNGVETNRMEFLTPAGYYLCRQVYPDPGLLCSQAILFSERYRYVDMIDRKSLRAEDLGDRLILTSTFVFAGDGTGLVEDVQPGERGARYSRIEIDAGSMLPQVVEHGRVAVLESYRVEAEGYFSQEGVSYPRRGHMKFSRNGRTRKIIYFIVDVDSSDLKASLEDEEFLPPTDGHSDR